MPQQDTSGKLKVEDADLMTNSSLELQRIIEDFSLDGLIFLQKDHLITKRRSPLLLQCRLRILAEKKSLIT